MPDRDYYLSTTPHMAELRKQYQAHIAAMFQLAGFADPAARAARVFALETKMAEVHATRVESEDVHGAVDVEARGTGRQGSRARLAGAARCGRTERRAGLHRLAPQSDPGLVRARCEGAARRVEGLAGVSR